MNSVCKILPRSVFTTYLLTQFYVFMKKFLLSLCTMLLTVGAWASTSVTWESYSGWTRNNVASAYWVGITTPGTTSDTYKMSDFQFCQETGYGASTCYTAIASTAPTGGAVLSESDVLAVSTNSVTATAQEYYTYTLSEEIELTGATTYYMVFLSSNTATDGYYTVCTQRISLNTSYGTYAPSVMAGNGNIFNNWTPGFKATLSTDAVYTVTYSCYSAADNSLISSGTVDDVVAQFSAPEIDGYEFGYATDANGDEVTMPATVTADTEYKLYYYPVTTITVQVLDGESNVVYTASLGDALYGTSYDVADITGVTNVVYSPSEVTGGNADQTVQVTYTYTHDYPFVVAESFDAISTWYYLKLKDAVYAVYSSAEDPNISMESSYTIGDENAEWAFVGSTDPFTGSLTIYNRAAGKDLMLTSADPTTDGSTGGKTYPQLTNEVTADISVWYPCTSTNITNGFYLSGSRDIDGYCMNLRDGKLAFWTGGKDSGSTFTVEEVSAAYDVLSDLIAEVTPYIGTGLGQYDIASDVDDAKAVLDAATSTEDDYINACTALETAFENGIVLPADNTFLRIQSVLGDNGYIKEAAINGRMTCSTTADAATIFLYKDSKLIGLTTGCGHTMVYKPTVGTETSDYDFVAAVSGTLGKYSVTSTYNSNTNYLYSTGVDGSNADRNTYATKFANQNTFTLEEVTTLPISVSDAGYATLYAPVALTIPAGVEAFAVTAIENDEATLTAVETTIPANTPVILKADEGSYDFDITTSDATVENKLAGALPSVEWVDEYTLQNSDAGVGLFNNDVTILAGFKAYLPASEVPAGVKGVKFDIETAVKAIEAAQQAGETMYDLNGRRIFKAQKGVYIINGKKIAIK